MTTFSQLVDAMVAETRRRDLKIEIEAYVNQTIRDCHFNEDNRSLVLFGENRREAITYADADESHVWPIEKPQLFAQLEVIHCPDVELDAVLRNPAQMNTRDNINGNPLYYRTGPTIAISGFGQTDSPIHISWFAYPRRLTYYAEGLRPMTWNPATEVKSYHADYAATAQLRETADELTTNWLLTRWEDLIREGVRAKLYKKLNDSERMRSAYSAFESNRRAMVAAETYETQVTLIK